MRGRDIRVLYKIPGIGITPAYAGKRQRRMGGLVLQEDHPRVCGEEAVSGKPS